LKLRRPGTALAHTLSCPQAWARSGFEDSVVTMHELLHGDDVKGTELEGIHREALVRALRVLEQRGQARWVGGSGGDLMHAASAGGERVCAAVRFSGNSSSYCTWLVSVPHAECSKAAVKTTKESNFCEDGSD
jgi:hypothetical protein